MGRLLGIDYGRARIGLACSDEMKMIATPYKTVKAQKTLELSVDHLLTEIAEKGAIEAYILGLPLHMSGDESEMSKEVREFGKILEEKTGKLVIYWDERLTSMMVDNAMKEGNLSRKDRAEAKDYLSASVLLQSYMQSQS
ncbi:MAG: Holliday junction resolvase RuvX [Rhabdochlamydiaceae bacterium]|nr:Holliday junction resolvase RuvX [Candidatus Amphrikana amoebophyrae]